MSWDVASKSWLFQRHGCSSPWHPVLQPGSGAGVGGAPLLQSVLDPCALYCKTEILSLRGSNSFFYCNSEGIVDHKPGSVIIFCLYWFPLYMSSLSCAPFPFVGHSSVLWRKTFLPIQRNFPNWVFIPWHLFSKSLMWYCVMLNLISCVSLNLLWFVQNLII